MGILSPAQQDKNSNAGDGLTSTNQNPRKRRARSERTLIQVNTQTGVYYLVVPYKDQILCTAIDGFMMQRVSRSTWNAQMKKGSEKAYFYTQFLMSDGKKKRLGLHVLVHMYKHGELPPGLYVDHRDRNPLNNHKANLRLLPPQLNSFNSDRVIDGTSRYPGCRGTRQTIGERSRRSTKSRRY
jgi:HNH endonuclease